MSTRAQRKAHAAEQFERRLRTTVETAEANARENTPKSLLALAEAQRSLVAVDKMPDVTINVQMLEQFNRSRDWLERNAEAIAAAELHVTLHERMPTTLRQWESSMMESVQKLACNLTTDPLNALSWSQNAFRDAARLDVTRQIMDILTHMREHDKTDVEIRDALINFAEEQVLRRAENVASSTSATANLADDYLRVAWTKMRATLLILRSGYFFGHIL